MLPLADTKITVLRPQTTSATDPYDDAPAESVVASGVRAHISKVGSINPEQIVGGQQESLRILLDCDPTDLTHTDRVRDEKTREEYEVEWVLQRSAGTLSHTAAGLKQVEGLTR